MLCASSSVGQLRRLTSGKDTTAVADVEAGSDWPIRRVLISEPKVSLDDNDDSEAIANVSLA